MKIVKQRSTASSAVAAVPVPGVDVAADIGIMLEVIGKINKKFGLSSEEIDELDGDEKQKIAVLITSVGSDFAGKVITKELVTKALKKSTCQSNHKNKSLNIFHSLVQSSQVQSVMGQCICLENVT
ncbi:hypothetical protein [Mammaliicoccus sciuri]|uniref:hypothetical protein n=1 Tax=Mammaliicoccus sciuri TaxID=1296 RepID=UPI001EF4382B|nr:hypothetical protein [Mammaliicoccus sciuri]